MQRTFLVLASTCAVVAAFRFVEKDDETVMGRVKGGMPGKGSNGGMPGKGSNGGMPGKGSNGGMPGKGGNGGMPGKGGKGGMAGNADVCKFILQGTPVDDQADVPTAEEHAAALKELDLDEVRADMSALLLRSQECWPADFGNYGPFMVRLAWHASGSFRISDNVGGPIGGRMRFEPERSWEDNTHLDKARALLYPLKRKYGAALSWGDLMVLAGTQAYRDAGLPLSNMCYGRMDEPDGSYSLPLGPSKIQEKVAPCSEEDQANFRCSAPLGALRPGLIYVNAAGVIGDDGEVNPDPALSAVDVRDVFARMGQDDRGTVALIGGGHAIGKVHGACPGGTGLSPAEAYDREPMDFPWIGTCNKFPDEAAGRGNNTVTSGFEGPWTSNPTKWDNEFFKYLLSDTWVLGESPAGNPQWYSREHPDLIRLTPDLALLYDKDYKKLVVEFAKDLSALNEAFDSAWFQLTTRCEHKGTWSTAVRCDGGEVPECLKMMSSDSP